MGVTSLVSEILLLSKTANFSLSKHGLYIKRFNCLELAQKIMQVGVDVTCINTNFGGRDLSSFGDIATFKNGQFFPFDPWAIGHQKIQLLRIGSKKIMQVDVDVTCINTNFGGRDLFGFGDIATFKNGHIVHGHQKIQLLRIGSKKSCK